MSANAKATHGCRTPQYIAQLLGDWWTRPDPKRLTLWGSTEYQKQVCSLWRENVGEASEKLVKKLFFALAAEQSQLAGEYERLFVGPAALPCPPYEAVWRTDRPKHEQGTVIGKSTEQVKEFYRELGLQMRADQIELADHIAVELEALACAWDSNADAVLTEGLVCRLRQWLPPFCASVIGNSKLEFYRALAESTKECFSADSPLLRIACVADRGDQD